MQETSNVGIECECQKCGYKWKYRGNSQWYISCPRCRNAMKSPLASKSQ